MTAAHGDPSPGRRRPVRTCIGCRRSTDHAALLRTVSEEGGAIAVGRRLPGRGAWICPEPACWARAAKARAWDRALRTRLDGDAVTALIAPDGALARAVARHSDQVTVQPAAAGTLGNVRR